ncbi:oncostatin-M-specific receptor subunit beta [Anabas testudineus]|uniref:Fibronectin type-III domain-containing protein n=1 Tax=Anabas testudineus TaxID=64144 RepID=A0A3Q1JD25_ANATE|nr:oncostatin-M-specific receptor subunit beta [Anabas testudineus]
MFLLRRFRIFLIRLLWFCLIFSEDHNGCCFITVGQPPSPNISLLPAVGGKQSLVVSWPINHSDLAGELSEIQISRTENHIIIYSENVSVVSPDLDGYKWTWTSDLPLECVDHSVRIRHFYNDSVLSSWSKWTTNPGVKIKDKIEIFPFQKMLRGGTSAMFCCVPPPGVNITNFTLRGKEYPLISIGAKVKAIAVDNLTIQPGNSIYKYFILLGCNGTAGDTRHINNYIGFPPQKPINLSCVTSNMADVYCTWDPGRIKQLPRNTQTQTLRIENSDQAPISCAQSSCTFAAIPQLEEYKISLVVKNKLGEETQSYSFNISSRAFPVVESVTVSRGVTDATVSWIIKGRLTQLNLLCQVSTDPHGTTEISCGSGNSCCKVQLDLIPNTRYSTKVRCSVSGRPWGEWTQSSSFTTHPLVTLNLWRRIKEWADTHSRQVTLLWTSHVPGSATTVAIKGYTVQWSQEGQNRTVDSGQTQTEISIGPGQCDFTVQAVLDRGLAVPAHLTIPKMDVRESFSMEKHLNSSTAGGFSLSWAEQVTATCGYTVEWCSQGNLNVPCTLQWMKMPKRNNTLVLPAGNFKAGCRYTFNIYECTEHGHRLLERQTGYSQELQSVQSPSLVKTVQRTSSSVTLEWSFNETDPAHPAFITGYLVTVQDVLPGYAAANVFSVVVADPQRKSVTIERLQENHEYAFSVSALTKNGPGQAVTVNIMTRRNYSAHLAEIMTPLFLLLGCTILLWPQRKKLSKKLKEIFVYPAGMNIKATELTAFLNKTNETVLSHKPDECISCDIEILNTSPPLNQTSTLKDPEPTNKLPSPDSQSYAPSSSPSSGSYCPQSAALLYHRAADQQTSITNKSYFHTMVDDAFEPQQVKICEIKYSVEPHESLGVEYGYMSNESF